MARQRSPFDPSPSPPAHSQPLTKRDVRRQRITDKLSGMIRSFDQNQQMHYQVQMRAVQVDMNLVLRADLQAAASTGEDGALLEDGGDEIKKMVEEASVAVPEDEAMQRDYWNLAGSRYREFAREVNDCVEQRDADLSALHNNYYHSIAELDRLTQQKLHQAEQEHQALSSTIRQRLISSLNKKRQQLLRDKEQLDIAADNPLLLHPNHFRIDVPGSPSNGTANRKTRHLRHRAGSPAPGELDGNGNRRKRKFGLVEDEGNESPAPYKPLGPPPDNLGGGRSPFKDAREKHAYTQFEAPAYSLERIFTEKELAMASDTARMATYKHFNQPPEQEKAGTNSNGTAVPSIDGELADAAAPTTETDDAAATMEPGANGTPPPSHAAAVAAPEMERSSSHMTRGAARNNPLAALEELANAASFSDRTTRGLRRDKDPFAPVLPNYHAVMRSEKSGAPTPSGVSGLEAESDFQMIRSLRQPADGEDADMLDADEENEDDSETLRKKLLDQALSTNHQAAATPFRHALLETGPAHIGKGVERLAATGFAPVPDYLAQRAKASVINPTSEAAMLGSATAAGVGGVGGAASPGGVGAMAAALRGQLSGAGGEPMSRTTSAGGSEAEGPGVGTRGRGRGRLV